MDYIQRTIALRGFSSSSYDLHTPSEDIGANETQQGQNEMDMEQRPLAAEASTSKYITRLGAKSKEIPGCSNPNALCLFMRSCSQGAGSIWHFTVQHVIMT